MDLVLRGIVVYVVLLVFLRAAGNREFSQLTAFDLVLLIVVAETTQGALLGADQSVTGAVVLISTFVGLNIVFSMARQKWRRADRYAEGVPILLIDEGELREENLRKSRIGLDEIMEAARQTRAIENLEDVKYAVLETDGRISIIPWS